MSAQEPIFLSREVVDYLHSVSLSRYGGLSGVRDDGLVSSAIAAAKHTWLYGGGDLFDIAAAYAFHISQAQAFFDGNKRTAVASAFAFLELNGVTVTRDDGQIYDALIAIAERRMDKAELAALFRRLFSPLT
jgi:death-on-curing protein